MDVRVEGVLSAFWQATYWYRLEDGPFLRYQSVHGPVGTETTVVTVASAAAAETDIHHVKEIGPSDKGQQHESAKSTPVP